VASVRPVVTLGAVLALAFLSCAREEGPVSVAWDRTRCAQCGMLVSDPVFAAQRHSEDGEVFHYDDPGCLLVTLDAIEHDHAAGPGRVYFHHHREDRWLRAHDVAFAGVVHSPMGYGLAAFARGQDPAALTITEAIARAVERDRERRAP